MRHKINLVSVFTLAKKIGLSLGVIVTILTLTSCDGGGKHVTVAELYGTWYAQNTGLYQTISFMEDGSYQSEGFLPDGSFQIAKDGTVKLVDKYRTVVTLTPGKDEDGWSLVYDQPYIPAVFTRQVVSEKDFNEAGDVNRTENEIFYMSTVDQFLRGNEWVTSDGKPVKFSENSMQIGDEVPLVFIFQTADAVESGIYTFELSNADGTYMGRITEKESGSGTAQYSVTLKLNGVEVLSASANGPMIVLTQP